MTDSAVNEKIEMMIEILRKLSMKSTRLIEICSSGQGRLLTLRHEEVGHEVVLGGLQYGDLLLHHSVPVLVEETFTLVFHLGQGAW